LFVGGGALSAPEKSGVFMGVKPAPAVGAVPQKMFRAKRLRFDERAILFVGRGKVR
jgi:hypothetical protein